MDEDELNRLSLEEESDDIPFPGQTDDVSEPIDEDIQHTVGRLLHTQPRRSRIGHRESRRENGSETLTTETIFSKALQAERNHWKERLQMSMHEIDRQHKIIITTQAGLEELVKSLKHSVQKNVIFEEDEDEESTNDIDHEVVSARLIENLKFQVRQLRVRAGVGDVSRSEIEEYRQKQKMMIKEQKEKISQLEDEKESLELDLKHKSEKIAFLQKENVILHRQVQKLQKIVAKYNESHSGANFHLNAVKKASEKSADRSTLSALDLSETLSSASMKRERTYIEGDQLVSYPSPIEESAIIKERLKRNIYSARQAKSSSNNVAQCLRCQALFKPPENTRKSCQFHHKGREIKEQFLDNGKLERVEYKWACCKKPLDAPGCCFGYHV